MRTHRDMVPGDRADSALIPAPADYVEALVCGLPAAERKSRLLMMLQAYIDDSGSHKRSRVYVLAGLISTVENWKAFSDEWRAKLDETPALKYFKMSEAIALRGQFLRGWTPTLRDQRVFELCEIIKKHAMVRIDSWLQREHFEKIVAGIDDDPSLSNPYFACFYQLVFSILTYRLDHGGVDCDMIFDDQGPLGYHAIQNWDATKIVPFDMNRARARADLLARVPARRFSGTISDFYRFRGPIFGRGLSMKDSHQRQIIFYMMPASTHSMDCR